MPRSRERYRLDHVVSTDATAGCYYSGIEGQRIYTIEPVRVTDRPGAGDALVGGTLHGYLGNNVMEGINYGLRTSKLALTHYGDLTHVSAKRTPDPHQHRHPPLIIPGPYARSLT